MNKSEQTGPHRSLEINLGLLLQVKLCFYSQEQPFPNGQTDPSPSASPLVLFVGLQCISSELLGFRQWAACRSLTWQFPPGNCCCTLPFIYRHNPHFLTRAHLPAGLFPYLGPSGALAWAGSGDLRRSGSGCRQEEVVWGESLSPSEPGGASGCRAATPSNSRLSTRWKAGGNSWCRHNPDRCGWHPWRERQPDHA